MRELQIHAAFIAWLRKLDIPYVHHDPTRKSGIRTGWPDFTILFMGHVVCIEVKTPTGKTSKAQDKCIADIQRSGNKVVIARSVEMAIDACKDILCIGNNLSGGVGSRHADAGSSTSDQPFTGPQDDVHGGSSAPPAQNLSKGKPATKTRSRRTTVDTPVMAGCDTIQPKRETGRGSSCRTESAGPLFVANILGTDWVCRGDSSPGGIATRVRKATHGDIIALLTA